MLAAEAPAVPVAGGRAGGWTRMSCGRATTASRFGSDSGPHAAALAPAGGSISVVPA
jgi:hypothetical protein